MKVTPLQKYWLERATKFNLNMDIPYTLHLQNGEKIHVEVRLKHYGDKNGMLIVSDFSTIEDYIDEIEQNEFGYSCMSQPSEDEIYSDEGVDDLLDDWRLIS